MTLLNLTLLLANWLCPLTGSPDTGWTRSLVLLAVTAGFAVVRVAAHRSSRSTFRLNPRDPFQWAELGFFLLLALLALLPGRSR